MFDYETYLRGGSLPFEDETYDFIDSICGRLDNVAKNIIMIFIRLHFENDYIPSESDFSQIFADVEAIRKKRKNKKTPINDELFSEHIGDIYFDPCTLGCLFDEIKEETAKSYDGFDMRDYERKITDMLIPALRYFDEGEGTTELKDYIDEFIEDIKYERTKK